MMLNIRLGAENRTDRTGPRHACHPSPRRSAACVLAATGLLGLAFVTGAHAQSLSTFAVLAGSTITNTGISTINGNIGLSPGNAATGLAAAGANSVVLTGTIHIADAVAVQAKSDLTTAFNVLSGRPTTQNLTGQTLGSGGTVSALSAGVYNFDTSASLNGILTLNGNANDVFIFKIGSTLTTAPGSSIVLNGVNAANVFFVVGSSATLDTTTVFQGQILALTSITLNTGATISCGAAWARNGAVTLDTNTIGICTFTIAPGTLGAALAGSATPAQSAAIAAINAFLANGGVLPLGFEVLALMLPEELALALNQLSGEAGASVAPAGMQAMDSFLGLIAGEHGGPGVVTLQSEAPGTVSVMGYASEPAPARGSALAGIDESARMPNIARWSIWAAAYGGRGVTNGDAAAGTHASTTSDLGYAVGYETHVSADTLFGFAVSGGNTNFDLSDSLGSGRSAMLQAALYGRSNFDQAYLSMALAYGYHDVITDRYVTIGGTDHFRAEFAGHDVAGQLEAGYDMGWFTPYVGVRGQAYLTPAYSEETVSGSSTFALDHAANRSYSLRSEVGARFNWSTDIGTGQLVLHASAAWAHEYFTGNSVNTSFQALPGSNFTVAGAARAADSILLSAGAGVDFDNGFSLAGTLDGALTSNAHRYGGSVRVGYSW